MANLSIRKLDDVVYKKLQERAVLHAISMEEEARRMITQAVMTSDSITATFQECFGPENGVDFSIPHQRAPHDPIDF
jgi:plasmid stability protein